MKTSILANREDVRKVEAEAQHDFIFFVLESLEIPTDILEECFPETGLDDFGVEQKIKLRKYLRQFDVHIIHDGDGGIKIYVDRDVVAEWKKCIFSLREDRSAIDPNDRLYVEVHINYWTIFDNIEEDGEEHE